MSEWCLAHGPGILKIAYIGVRVQAPDPVGLDSNPSSFTYQLHDFESVTLCLSFCS